MRKSAIVFAAVALLGLASPSAFAQLSCTSAWITNEDTPHCHVVVAQTGDENGHFICTTGIDLASVSTSEGCASLCADNEGRQSRLEALILANTSKMSASIGSLVRELISVKKQALMACIKSSMLEAIIDSAAKATGEHTDLE